MRVKPKPFESDFEPDYQPSSALLNLFDELGKTRSKARGQGYEIITNRPSRSAPERRYYQETRRMMKPCNGVALWLWQKQNGRCQYCCGSLLPRYHIDHIHPRSKGGSNHRSNYCLACEACNLSKRTQSAESFAISLLL